MTDPERTSRGITTPVHARLEQCIRACDDRTGLKIVVAPSSYAARMLRASLARQGCPLVNVEALTPAELAGHVVRTMEPDDRRRTISRSEGAFLMRTLTGQLDSDEASLLGRAAFPLWSAVLELRASGASAADVAGAARRPHERVLAELHAAYEAYLNERQLRDAADIMLSAITLSHEFARRRAPELVAVLDQVRLSEQEAKLLRIVSGAAKRSFRIGCGSIEWPDDRAARILQDWPRADVREEDAAAARPVITAGERREEVASVLADIVAAGLSFDDVEIAWTSGDPYRQEVAAACGRYGIPVSGAGPKRLAVTYTGASVIAALRWVAGGYPVDGLVSMLRMGYVNPPGGEAAEIAAVLDRFPMSLAQTARPDVRQRLFERARQEYVDTDTLKDAFRLLDALRNIAPGRTGTSGAELVGFVESFIQQHARIDAATDEVAAFLLSELAFLGGAASETGFDDASSAAAFAVQVLERLPIRNDPVEGGLTAVTLEEAGFGRASHVYVVGLDDRSCSERTIEDSLLSEAFRNRLRDHAGVGPIAEKPLPVATLLAALEAGRPGAIFCYRAQYDIAQDRPLFPAAGSAGAESAPGAGTAPNAGRAAAADRASGPESDGTPAVRAAPRTIHPPVLDPTDHFLSDPAGTSIEFAGALFENIEQARLAAEARADISWTAFDGVVVEAEDLLPDAHSPSKLEDLATCPYRYFLRHVLRVPVHDRRDPDEWMTARERGQILHSLFERHARRRMNGDGPEGDAAWLRAEVSDLLEQFCASNPPPHEAFVEEARHQIEAAGAVYLHTEYERPNRQPHAAEFRFGSDDDADAPPLEIEFPDGATLSLIGRVDRVDMTADGGLVVTDFKTGNRRGLSESDLRKLDTTLQWAIYARLAGAHFGRPVEASGYLFVSTRELGLRREAAPPPDEELDRLLADMHNRVSAGFFARNANPNGDPCRYCDFRAVCGDLRARRDEMRAKACESVRARDRLAPLIETWNAFSSKICS